ncbi:MULTISPECIES: NFACT family protein [Aerococcus]|uniref:Rqc2 homolog RqcH n=2 Tax=Aerococcus TaxID=1375 RepID=A0A5N1GM52_9LACT|nr:MULTISPECIES: NFACT RNA binding domain-containing protein [Aerococcus]KAA9301862.1 fibronectin/fibrinogen-binding protein [Aerococcus sanguinicola]MDK6368716.1 NFACT RNA binding domain-containing protein [Aerococcus sp. UMB9870]MDK6679264.1 NFACT RNA binding domain-containing protein [Aerococcus sp. UMB8608]MDK6685894.1 NFACT RNA binding domain-containing protein [Aerococcus sp. UMB8623]MDK6939339.1 NFACT RNA binding domain-containing protein [Aerococcus sp. UMB8487]
MSFDGMFTHSMTSELKETLTQGKINKIQQPSDYEVLITVRKQGQNHKLLLSAHPDFARAQLSQVDYPMPDSPANFCMVLRKYLKGALVLGIKQYENDRLIRFDLLRTDEIGDQQKVSLIVEIMGRHSNIILVDHQGQILDVIKRIPVYQNRYRTLLPGASYQLPPYQNKANPFKIGPDWQPTSQQPLSRQVLQSELMGLGRESADEILYRAQADPDQPLGQIIHDFCQSFDQAQPCLTFSDKKLEYTAFPYLSLRGERETYPSLGQLLDVYYARHTERQQVQEIGQQIDQVTQRELKHQRKKQKNLRKDLEKSQKADHYQLFGELLTSNLYQLKDKQESVDLPNYYDDNRLVHIPLKVELSPAENAQAYYQKYNKLTNSRSHIQEQLAKSQEEIDYLESIQAQIEWSNPKELELIREELKEEGYIKDRKKKTHKRIKPLKPRQFTSPSGYAIKVGRNNKQNDQLTMRQANKNHYWFHVKDIPGSHVILESDQAEEEDIRAAASIAAHYSKARHSNNVPVDYTLVKDVKKPNGAKPGFVNYFNQKTVFVTPAQIANEE